jgi:hypothetical protein
MTILNGSYRESPTSIYAPERARALRGINNILIPIRHNLLE